MDLLDQFLSNPFSKTFWKVNNLDPKYHTLSSGKRYYIVSPTERNLPLNRTPFVVFQIALLLLMKKHISRNSFIPISVGIFAINHFTLICKEYEKPVAFLGLQIGFVILLKKGVSPKSFLAISTGAFALKYFIRIHEEYKILPTFTDVKNQKQEIVYWNSLKNDNVLEILHALADTYMFKELNLLSEVSRGFHTAIHSSPKLLFFKQGIRNGYIPDFSNLQPLPKNVLNTIDDTHFLLWISEKEHASAKNDICTNRSSNVAIELKSNNEDTKGRWILLHLKLMKSNDMPENYTPLPIVSSWIINIDMEKKIQKYYPFFKSSNLGPLLSVFWYVSHKNKIYRLDSIFDKLSNKITNPRLDELPQNHSVLVLCEKKIDNASLGS